MSAKQVAAVWQQPVYIKITEAGQYVITLVDKCETWLDKEPLFLVEVVE